MKRFLSFFLIVLMLCACSSNKSKVSDYLRGTHPEYRIVDDKMMEGTGFMPVNRLQATCNELEKAENQLRNAIPLDKETAIKLALEYKNKFSDVSALMRPIGTNDSKTITMICVPVDNEDDSTHVVFYLDKEGDNVEWCSLDFIEYEDEIMSRQRKVMDLVNYVLGDNNTKAEPDPQPEEKAEPQPEEESKDESKEEKVEE